MIYIKMGAASRTLPVNQGHDGGHKPISLNLFGPRLNGDVSEFWE